MIIKKLFYMYILMASPFPSWIKFDLEIICPISILLFLEENNENFILRVSLLIIVMEFSFKNFILK